MTVQDKPLNEITNEAIEILVKEMGVANTIRFMNQFTKGQGNYTEERDVLFKDMTLDGVLEEVKAARLDSKT